MINEIEALPKGLLFWRSSTRWLGGIGIILFTILILPGSNTSRFVLLNTEMSALAKTNFRYRALEILKILVYVNVGPGFAQESSLGNFSSMPDLGKFILSLNMLLGRLEIFGVISLFFYKIMASNQRVVHRCKLKRENKTTLKKSKRIKDFIL